MLRPRMDKPKVKSQKAAPGKEREDPAQLNQNSKTHVAPRPQTGQAHCKDTKITSMIPKPPVPPRKNEEDKSLSSLSSSKQMSQNRQIYDDDSLDLEALNLEECHAKTRNYKYVSEGEKEKLIRLVNSGLTISKAARIAKVKYSTAKHIVQRFKRKQINSNQANSQRQQLQFFPQGFGSSGLLNSQNGSQAIKKFADASCQTDALQDQVQNGVGSQEGNLRKPKRLQQNHPSCKCKPMGQGKEQGAGKRTLKKRDLGQVHSSQMTRNNENDTLKRQKLRETSEFTMVFQIKDGESKEKDQIDGKEPINQSQGLDDRLDRTQSKDCRDPTAQIVDSGIEIAMQKDEKDIQCGKENESIRPSLINETENMHKRQNLNSPLNLKSIQLSKDKDRTDKKVPTTRCLVTIDLQDFDQMQMVNFKMQKNADEPKEDVGRQQVRPPMPTANSYESNLLKKSSGGEFYNIGAEPPLNRLPSLESCWQHFPHFGVCKKEAERTSPYVNSQQIGQNISQNDNAVEKRDQVSQQTGHKVCQMQRNDQSCQKEQNTGAMPRWPKDQIQKGAFKFQSDQYAKFTSQLDQKYQNIRLLESASAAGGSGFREEADLQISRRLHLDPEAVSKCVSKGPAVAVAQGISLLPPNAEQQVSSLQNLTRCLQNPAVSAGAQRYKKFSLFDHYRLNQDA